MINEPGVLCGLALITDPLAAPAFALARVIAANGIPPPPVPPIDPHASGLCEVAREADVNAGRIVWAPPMPPVLNAGYDRPGRAARCGPVQGRDGRLEHHPHRGGRRIRPGSVPGADSRVALAHPEGEPIPEETTSWWTRFRASLRVRHRQPGASRLVGVVTDLPHGRPVAVLPDGRVIGSVTGPPLPE